MRKGAVKVTLQKDQIDLRWLCSLVQAYGSPTNRPLSREECIASPSLSAFDDSDPPLLTTSSSQQNPLYTVNLSNALPQIADLEKGPPAIQLPPNACISSNPKANAHPSYHRSTLNAIPTTHSLLQKSKLPLGVILSPYRSVREEDGDEPVPLVTDTVIARCRRCRTYINPYVTFIERGNRWKCCMCNISNEVPQLFDWDQEKNQPADRWKRHELNHSVVEFVAPREYMVSTEITETLFSDRCSATVEVRGMPSISLSTDVFLAFAPPGPSTSTSSVHLPHRCLPYSYPEWYGLCRCQDHLGNFGPASQRR